MPIWLRGSSSGGSLPARLAGLAEPALAVHEGLVVVVLHLPAQFLAILHDEHEHGRGRRGRLEAPAPSEATAAGARAARARHVHGDRAVPGIKEVAVWTEMQHAMAGHPPTATPGPVRGEIVQRLAAQEARPLLTHFPGDGRLRLSWSRRRRRRYRCSSRRKEVRGVPELAQQREVDLLVRRRSSEEEDHAVLRRAHQGEREADARLVLVANAHPRASDTRRPGWPEHYAGTEVLRLIEARRDLGRRRAGLNDPDPDALDRVRAQEQRLVLRLPPESPGPALRHHEGHAVTGGLDPGAPGVHLVRLQ